MSFSHECVLLTMLLFQAGARRFVETQEDDELLELDMDEGFDERGGEQLQVLLQRKMQVGLDFQSAASNALHS